MYTRSGLSYPRPEPPPENRCLDGFSADGGRPRKRSRITRAVSKGLDFFDGLPDDLILLIFSKLSATAGAPSDIINLLLTCRRFSGLAMHPTVLYVISPRGTGVRAKNWTESAHRFLRLCVDAGSVDASYTLGMISFYCLENRGVGASLMAKAAMSWHPEALYSLAVVQFNGSGGSKNDKDLRAGVALCARAAYHGHIHALRELGHCLQDGYGVRQNVADGRRFLVQANARELAVVLSAAEGSAAKLLKTNEGVRFSACSLLSDFGFSMPAPEAHPGNRFLVDWFAARGGPASGGMGEDGLRMCSYGGCGRPETRRHEFRRCSVCGKANYCSRACQALHWKLAHKPECVPMERWLDGDAVADPVADAGGGEG